MNQNFFRKSGTINCISNNNLKNQLRLNFTQSKLHSSREAILNTDASETPIIPILTEPIKIKDIITSKKCLFNPNNINQKSKLDNLHNQNKNIIPNNKKNLIDRKLIQESKNKELERLLKERNNLKMSMYSICDKKTSEISARKLYSLSQKIDKILRSNEGTKEFTDDERMKSIITMENFGNDLGDNKIIKINNQYRKAHSVYKRKIKVFNNIPDDLNEFYVKNNKIAKIFNEISLKEQKKKVDTKSKYDEIQEVPNFKFHRLKEKSLFLRTDNAVETLKMKSYKPKGFKTENIKLNLLDNQSRKPKENSNLRISKSAKINENTSQTSLFLTKTTSPDLTENRKIESARSIKNKFMIDVKNPNNRINIIKGVRKKIIDIFNENNKNQDFINKEFAKDLKNNQLIQTVEDDIDLVEKWCANKVFEKYDVDSSSSDEEEENRNFLRKVDKRARKYFINYFKNEKYEKRLFNRSNEKKSTFFERKVNQIKMDKQFKVIAHQTIQMKGTKLEDDVVDMQKELLKEIKSVQKIEWLLKKQKVLKK